MLPRWREATVVQALFLRSSLVRAGAAMGGHAAATMRGSCSSARSQPGHGVGRWARGLRHIPGPWDPSVQMIDCVGGWTLPKYLPSGLKQ